jgi:hypothetical protein
MESSLRSTQAWPRIAGWLIFVLLLPLFKLTELPTWSIFLWAEDADLFLRQGIDQGARSVLMPYAGYIHLYTRLVAWCATFFSPEIYPVTMAAGWLIAYLLACSLLVRWVHVMRIPRRWGVVAIASVLLQPHGGEVFFSATNAQWFLGLYLFVYFIWIDRRSKVAGWVDQLDSVVIVVASLSGPFSLLVLPVILLRRFLQGNAYSLSWRHGWLFVAGLVQLIFVLSDERMRYQELAQFHVDQWAIALVRLVAFCAHSPAQMLAAFALLGAGFGLAWFGRQPEKPDANQDGWLVVCSVGILLLASMWAHKMDPLSVVPEGAGNRYTWIPYGLTFLLICQCAARAGQLAQLVVALLIFAVCGAGHRAINRSDLQYHSFVDFAKIRSVRIPMHPQIEGAYEWHLQLGQPHADEMVVPGLVYAPPMLVTVEPRTARVSEEPGGWRFSSQGQDPQLLFGAPLNCQPGVSVGVEVRMWRASPGWIQLFWSKDNRFSGRRSLRRFYPAGAVVAQFAFRNPSQFTHLRLDPADADVDALIQSVDVYCLEEKRP